MKEQIAHTRRSLLNLFSVM